MRDSNWGSEQIASPAQDAKKVFMKRKTLLISLCSSLLLGLLFCFFLSIFANLSSSYSEHNSIFWFQVNRGYPQAWAGTSVVGKNTPWYLIKAPFVTASISTQDYVETWDKLIDVTRFLPLWLISSVCTLPLTWVLIKAGEENKKLQFLWKIAFLLGCALLVFLYFFWFPRV